MKRRTSPSAAAATAFSPGFDTPAGAFASPLSSCGPTTCARGPSPDAPLCDILRNNTKTVSHESRTAVRNSPAGHTADVEKIFCCVTTRRRAKPFRPTEIHWSAAVWGHASGALAPPRRASDAPRAQLAALAAASSLASDAPPADNRGLGSSVGSTAVPGRTAHSPWQGKVAIPVDSPWSNHPPRRYAVHDPWEVTAPLGQPGEDVDDPPRALIPWCLVPSSIAHWCPPSPMPLPSAKERGLPRKVDIMLPIDHDIVNRSEGDQEGHVPDMRWPEGYPGRRCPQSRRGKKMNRRTTATHSL